MTFHLDPKPTKPRRNVAYYVGYVGALLILASIVGVIVAAAIAAIRGFLGA